MLGLPARLLFLALLFSPGHTCPFPQQLGSLLFPFLLTRSQGAELELEMLRKGWGLPSCLLWSSWERSGWTLLLLCEPCYHLHGPLSIPFCHIIRSQLVFVFRFTFLTFWSLQLWVRKGKHTEEASTDLYRWRRQWHPTPVLLPGKSHGWRSLVGCSPWGC